ncbi:hypothetical protein OHB14_57665 [Streptomyces sp. NBC_01613]|uniref:hypothetical protein n=1 Tax=Streptomyces sp. NBC_01613 TaxID=2975896 RepID=UPI0038641667
MNRTALVPRRSLAGEPAPAPYAELTHGSGTHGPGFSPPIYAQLVAEWRAKGRAVPGHPDVQWASFAGLPDDGRRG